MNQSEADRVARLSDKVAGGQRTFGQSDLDLIQALCCIQQARIQRAITYGS